ncbi:MAG: PilW family protein [Thermodesulfovibrionales bacterium]
MKIKKQEGFSLVELMITMAVFIIAIAAATGVFIPLTNQFKQQSKMAESNIEGIIGLELLRLDLEHAGYGLPWFFQNTISYNEASSSPASSFNDAPNTPPRAIVSGESVINGSDYLIIKSTLIAGNETSQRWSIISEGSDPKTWGSEDLRGEDRVIVIKPKVSDTRLRELVMNGSTFYTTFSSSAFPSQFSPSISSESYLIYGIDPNTNLRMPFNRADYFISNTNVPQRCAPNTGVLVKAVVSHDDGDFDLDEDEVDDFMPLLDCVADMQVIYRFDMDGDNDTETISNADGGSVSSSEGASVTTVQETLNNAELLRNRLKEIRIYILAHEGQYDRFYTFNNFTCGTNCITVGEFGLGRDFDLSTITPGNTNYLNYRWKVYSLVVKPQNLR